MTIQFIKELGTLYLQKKEVLEDVLKLINDTNTKIQDILTQIDKITNINAKILSLKCECEIIDVSRYFLNFQQAIRIEYKIEDLVIEICQDKKLAEDLKEDDSKCPVSRR